MEITRNNWRQYIQNLAKADDKAAEMVTSYLQSHEIASEAGFQAFVDFYYAVVTKYAEGASEMAAQAYEALAEVQGVTIKSAMPAETPSRGECEKTIRGTMLDSDRVKSLAQTAGRLVRRTGVDTTINNALRDGAEWAWVPSGDTCAFCMMLASNGWQRASKKAIKNGHASHIHANCDCTYAIRFDGKSTVEGYDPDYYKALYDNAEGTRWQDKLNSMRRDKYAQNKDKINAQKRLAYAIQKGNAADEVASNTNTSFESEILKEKLNPNDYDAFKKIIDDNPNQDIRNLYTYYLDDIADIQELEGAGEYDPTTKIVKWSKTKTGDGVSEFETFAHENNHSFDRNGVFKGLTFKEVETIREKCDLKTKNIFGKVASSSDQFMEAVRKDKEVLRRLWKENKKAILATDASGGVQDAIDGLFGKAGTVWGHGETYYNSWFNQITGKKGLDKAKELQEAFKELGFDASNQLKVRQLCRQYKAASEIWANVGAAATNRDSTLEWVEKFLPNSYNAYKEIIANAVQKS